MQVGIADLDSGTRGRLQNAPTQKSYPGSATPEIRILLALAQNGKSIPRSEGGPLYLVHPITQFPELRRRYDSTAWVFYVTPVILGTEPARLRVGKRVLTAADLDQLLPVTRNWPVGDRLFWPHGNVQLQGVKGRTRYPRAPTPSCSNDKPDQALLQTA